MRRLMLKFINYYQKKISPGLDRKCRHNPSCSNYAKIAYTRYHFPYATFLTTKRLLKCNRLFKPAYDPVPLKYSRIVKKSHRLLKKGKKDYAIDATCGNGNDTIFLSKYYKKVTSFDIQPLALKRTKEKMYYVKNVDLILDSFIMINKYVSNADAIIFNLGFLPGSDHSIKTSDYQSYLAILNAFELLNNNGALIICCYKNHNGGLDEYLEIKKAISHLNYKEFSYKHKTQSLFYIRKI